MVKKGPKISTQERGRVGGQGGSKSTSGCGASPNHSITSTAHLTLDKACTGSHHHGWLWSPTRHSPPSQISKPCLQNDITCWLSPNWRWLGVPDGKLGRLLPKSPCFAFSVFLFYIMLTSCSFLDFPYQSNVINHQHSFLWQNKTTLVRACAKDHSLKYWAPVLSSMMPPGVSAT